MFLLIIYEKDRLPHRSEVKIVAERRQGFRLCEMRALGAPRTRFDVLRSAASGAAHRAGGRLAPQPFERRDLRTNALQHLLEFCTYCRRLKKNVHV